MDCDSGKPYFVKNDKGKCYQRGKTTEEEKLCEEAISAARARDLSNIDNNWKPGGVSKPRNPSLRLRWNKFCTCLGIALTTMREIYNKAGISKKTKTENSRTLQESVEWLQKYAERRETWHNIRNGFCKTYSDISLPLTRKLQIMHYSQCGRCGRIGHDALDPFVCPLNGFESLPPLNEEEDRKKMEERKAMAKEKLVSRFASPKSSKNFHSLSLKLSQSPKYFHSMLETIIAKSMKC